MDTMNIKINPIKMEMIEEVAKLATVCFADDHFYSSLSTSINTKEDKIYSLFKRSIEICIRDGLAYYCEEDGSIISFALWFNFFKLKAESPDSFSWIFQTGSNTRLSEKIDNELEYIDEIAEDNLDYLYLLAIGVDPRFRNKGYATQMINIVLNAYPQYNILSDISNDDSLGIYTELGFELLKKVEDCTFVLHRGKQDSYTLNPGDKIMLALPKEYEKTINNSTSRNIEHITLNYTSICNNTQPDFTQSLYCSEKAILLNVSYEELLSYQRTISLLSYTEIIFEDRDRKVVVYYINTNGKNTRREFLYHQESSEDKITPDIYISIPISIEDLSRISSVASQQYNNIANKILYALRFRTKYETGIPISTNNQYEFKNRIKRYPLNNIKIQIQEELQLSYSGEKANREKIGSPIDLVMIASIDNDSLIGVVHLSILSCGIKATQLQDSFSRNQVNIVRNGEYINLYTYLKQEYGITKRGTAKVFMSIPHDRLHISDELIASILFCETYYNEEEGLGRVVDKSIKGQISDKYGSAQYSYASVYTHTNVLLEISEKMFGSINDRITNESITLFYIELILFEEAAINVANDKIIQFLSELNHYKPGYVLRTINSIISSYVRTIDFWNIQMNYPSSKQSFEDIRDAFNIKNEQLKIERNKEQLLNIHKIRSTIIDRIESAILSTAGTILTVVSAFDIITDSSKIPALSIIVFIIGLLLIFKRIILNNITNRV
jgi:GNAT superfamily N-acetyltransferase